MAEDFQTTTKQINLKLTTLKNRQQTYDEN